MTLDHIITGLKATVASIACKSIPTQMALLNYVWSRLARTLFRFERLYTHWQNGTVPPIRIRAPRKPRNPETPIAPVYPPVVPLPRRRFWLLDILKTHLAAIRAGQLEHLLTLPEIQQFRAEIPRADRILRPLCHMLGVTLPAAVAPQPLTSPEPSSPSPSWGNAGIGAQATEPLPFPPPILSSA